MEGVTLHLVDSLDECFEFKRWLSARRDALALDTETGGLEWWRESLRLVVVGDTEASWAIPWERWAGLVHETLPNYSGQIVMHNAKFDLHFLERAGISLRARIHDTALAAHLLDPTERVGLKSLAVRYLESGAAVPAARLEDTMRENGWTWRTVPYDFPPYWCYGALDGVLTARLWLDFEKRLRLQGLDALYEIEMAAQDVLYAMERRGARIDLDYCTRKRDELFKWETDARQWVERETGINPTSHRQLADYFISLGVKLTKTTPGGTWSMDEDVLAEIAHPIAETVLNMRQAHKIAKTYFSKFLDLADGDLLHASIKTLGARTGRMSIASPSMQNLPRGPVVRDAFIPSEGHVLVSADFDQIELRLLAHFAEETSMIEAIRNGVDLHGHTAALVYGGDYTAEQRQIAKGGNFAKVYGAGNETFARTVGISEHEAKKFMVAYDRAFPGVRRFMQTVTRVAKERAAAEGVGYVREPMGRVHPLELDALYKGVNYLIQGTAATLLKKTLIDLDASGLTEFMVLPVHDEIIFDVPVEQAAELVSEIEYVMRDMETYLVPITAKADVLPERWGDKYR